MAFNDNVVFLTQVIHCLQAGDPGGCKHLYLEHCRSHSRRRGRHRLPCNASVYKRTGHFSPFFSWNRIRHVATPEFSVVRHLILLQGGTTTGQRPSLTPAGKMCSPLTCRREKVNELATLCVCLVSPFPPSIVATRLLSTPPMGLGHHDQDLEPPSGSGQVRKGEYLS